MWKCSSCGNWNSDSLMVCPACLENPTNKINMPTRAAGLNSLSSFLLANAERVDEFYWFLFNRKEENNEINESEDTDENA